jgi:hypothetical protein
MSEEDLGSPTMTRSLTFGESGR